MRSLRTKKIVFLAAAAVVLITGALCIALRPAERVEAADKSALSQAELEAIVASAVSTANSVESPLRSLAGVPRTTKMQIAIVARDGKLLRFESMPDAWVGSIDIAIAKARTAAFFSSDENALTSRIIGVLSQAHNPDGSGGAGPLWGIGDSNQIGISGSQHYRNGIITFPGGVPLYKDGFLIGAIGVSGDGVDQDEEVAFGGAVGYEPGPNVAQLGF